MKNGYDVAAMKSRIIAETFKIGGPHRLAKVIPLKAAAGPMPYPPGDGIPQWKLIKKLRFRAAAQVGPGGMYSGDYR